MKAIDKKALFLMKQKGLKSLLPGKARITVGMGTCGIGNGSENVLSAIKSNLKSMKSKPDVVSVGCFGCCSYEPLVTVHVPNKSLVMFSKVQPEDVPSILEFVEKQNFDHPKILLKISSWDFITDQVEFGTGAENVSEWNEIPFFKWQKKIVLRNCGLIDPSSIHEFAAVGGYSAYFKALTEMKHETIIDEVKKSNLRGRGGAGFPTGRKWEIMRNVPGDKKYIICNADEGNPGSYMNRNEIEGDPHGLIEGMAIGAFTMGADEGIVYIRAEYPLAINTLRNAIKEAEENGFLGEKIFGTSFNFKIHIVVGAGAYVCGEENALIASIEGKAGRSRPRPPFPAQKGLWDKPTNINNVETWYSISPILTKGSKWYLESGSKRSGGTKVFSLVGKVKNTGLVEIPFGLSIDTMINKIGGGSISNDSVKAAQFGGPSGGCIPVSLFDTPIDYESIASVGAIIGSGGIVVMGERNCMVDVARYFVEFSVEESCGKCMPCRIGLGQLLDILFRITQGDGKESDIALLEKLCKTIEKTSLCGLGQTATYPVLSTLRYFKDEYLAHIVDKQCVAGSCTRLNIACENQYSMQQNVQMVCEDEPHEEKEA